MESTYRFTISNRKHNRGQGDSSEEGDDSSYDQPGAAEITGQGHCPDGEEDDSQQSELGRQ